MSIKDKYRVLPIKKHEAHPWLLYRHYARRLPPITHAFGLYEGNEIKGVCTFGMPCAAMNYGNCIFNEIKIDTLELNRLIIQENLPPNTFSFFVSQTFKMLKSPLCIVSFSDPNNGHQGYIYQATNFIYVELSVPGGKDCSWILNGRTYHGKTVTAEMLRNFTGFAFNESKTLKENWIENGGEITEHELKHRYIKLLGNRREIKNMRRHFKYKILPYPKGDNKRYDASADIPKQELLF